MDNYSDIATRIQRQDSLVDQLVDLRFVADILGMYDAGDWLQTFLDASNFTNSGR